MTKTLPPELRKAVYAACNSRNTFVVCDEINHCTLCDDDMRRLASFLEKVKKKLKEGVEAEIRK